MGSDCSSVQVYFSEARQYWVEVIKKLSKPVVKFNISFFLQVYCYLRIALLLKCMIHSFCLGCLQKILFFFLAL